MDENNKDDPTTHRSLLRMYLLGGAMAISWFSSSILISWGNKRYAHKRRATY